MGIYNIDSIEKTDYTIKIIAFDNMIKFESAYFSSLSNKPTLQQVVNELASKTGVEFTGSLPAYTVKKLEGFTCREVLGYIASICGGNAVITRDGKFTIVTPADSNYTIATSNYFDYKREEAKYKIGKISCQVEEKVLSKGSLGADSMELEFENPWIDATILTDIYNRLDGFEYLGYSMKWQGDPSLDVGDIVTITDKKGVVRKHPILSQKFTYTGGLTSEISAKSENKNKNSYNSNGPSTKKVERVVMELALINKALIDVAYIADLTAGNIKFDTASGTILDLQTLLSKFVTGENGQFLNLTTDNVVISNAVIKDAMIENVSLNKLKAGSIDTNKITLASSDGGLSIVGPTMQFKDKYNKIRIQIGRDKSNNFTFSLFDETGAGVLIDHTGIKQGAIANDLIVSDMIAGDSIGEKQINYSSFVSGFNKDTNTSTIKSSKVNIDLLNQTLDIAFNSLKTQADGTKSLTESHSTIISTMQGEIKTAINNTQIVKDGQTILLKDDYNRTVATVDSMRSTIGSHTTTINEHTGKITGVETRVNTVERDLDSITQRVSSTETNVTTVTTTANNANSNATNALNTANSANSKIDGLEIGGTNLIKNTSKEFATLFMPTGSWFSEFYTGVELIAGETYTFSIYVERVSSDTTPINLHFGLGTTESNYIWDFPNWRLNNIPFNKKISLTYTVKDTDLQNGRKYFTWRLRNERIETTIKYKMVKFEKGNKATDWTSAPEDIQSQIDANVTEISTTKSKVSTIETNLSNITSRVSTVETNQTSVNGKVTALETWKKTAEQKITDASIISTVSSQFYKKGEADAKYASQTQISQLSGQIALKVDANGVKSLIQQNPDSVKIGFNGIDARIKMTNDGLFLMNDSGKRRLGLRRASLYAYNYNTNEFLGGWSPRISQDNTVKGLGVLASKNADFYGIAYSPKWTNEEDDNPVGATSLMSINFKDRGTSIDLLKGIQFYDHVFIGGNLNMRNFNIRSVTGITCYGIYGTAWHTNEATPRLVFSIDNGTLKLNNSLNGNGNRAYGFDKITSTSNYVKNWYANHAKEKLMMHNDGWNMFADVGWDYQNNNLYRAKIVSSSYGIDVANNNIKSIKKVSNLSLIDEIEVVENLARTGNQLIIDVSDVTNKDQILLDDDNLAIEKLLPFLLKEIKDLKEEVRVLRAS